MRHAAFKALHGIVNVWEDAKEAIDGGVLHIEHRGRGHGGESHITVPLDCTLQTAKEKMQGVPVH